MLRPVDHRVGSSRSRPAGLVFFAVAAGALAFGEAALAVNSDPWGWVNGLLPLAGLVYVAAGLLAWVRRPRNRMGPLLCAGGLLWFAAGAVNLQNPTLFGVGLVAQTLPIAFVVHALLAYPSGRLRNAASWLLTGGIYVVALVLQAPLYLFRTVRGEPPVLLVAARPDVVEAVRQGRRPPGSRSSGAPGWSW